MKKLLTYEEALSRFKKEFGKSPYVEKSEYPLYGICREGYEETREKDPPIEDIDYTEVPTVLMNIWLIPICCLTIHGKKELKRLEALHAND